MLRNLAFAVAFCVLASAGARAQSPADLNRACVDKSSDGELAASRQLRDQAPETLAEIAKKYPRALGIAPTVLVARGEVQAALREYGAIIERLPNASDARAHFETARAELARHVEIAETGASRFAAAGYFYSGEIGGIIDRNGDSWLAVTWQQLGCGYVTSPEKGSIEIFRVENGQLKNAFVAEGAGMHPVPNSLVVNGPGRDPVIAVGDFSGGNCWGCNRLRIFTLGSGGIDEVSLPNGAPGVLTQIRDLDGDGRAEVLAIDARWEFWRELCHACSPGVFAVYRLAAGRLVEACAEYPAYYEEAAERSARDIPATPEFQFVAGNIVSVYLNLMQSGRSEEALKFLRTRLDPTEFGNAQDAERARESLDELTARHAKSLRKPSRACPVNAM